VAPEPLELPDTGLASPDAQGVEPAPEAPADGPPLEIGAPPTAP
jgi:hypothetical protein